MIGLIASFWAQYKLHSLQYLPDKNKEEILALGRKFNFVTSETSLLVLETLEQHIGICNIRKCSLKS